MSDLEAQKQELRSEIERLKQENRRSLDDIADLLEQGKELKRQLGYTPAAQTPTPAPQRPSQTPAQAQAEPSPTRNTLKFFIFFLLLAGVVALLYATPKLQQAQFDLSLAQKQLRQTQADLKSAKQLHAWCEEKAKKDADINASLAESNRKANQDREDKLTECQKQLQKHIAHADWASLVENKQLKEAKQEAETLRLCCAQHGTL